jgi:hypothetical protein
VTRVEQASRAASASVTVQLDDGTVATALGMPDPPPRMGDRLTIRVNDDYPADSRLANWGPSASWFVALVPIALFRGAFVHVRTVLRVRRRIIRRDGLS